MGVTWRWDQSPADRRSAARRQPTVGAVCRLSSMTGEELGTGLVWNLSTKGVSLLLSRRLEPGTVVRAELIGADGATLPRRDLRVAHAALLQTGDYVLGGQFDQELSPEAMRPYLA